MAISFKRVHFPFLSLAYSMATSSSEAEKTIDDFLASIGIVDTRRFHFEMVISQGGQKHVTYLAYAAVPADTQAKKPVQIVNLKRDTFIELVLTEQEYNDMLENKGVQNDLNDFVKKEEIKIDFSAVLALAEAVDGKQIVYIPYK